MVNKILTDAGFVLGETYRETMFRDPPSETYAVFNDSRDIRGSDDLNLIVDHDVTIELYEYTPDPEAEARIESAFDSHSIAYTKQSRYWIQSEQLYQIIYEFNYVEKRGE